MSHRSNRTVAIINLGCKVNQADADAWARQFLGLGYELIEPGDTADVQVINTCSVTHVADRKSRQLLRQARRNNPGALIVAAGCYASVGQAELAEIVGIDLIIGKEEKDRLVPLVHSALEGEDEMPLESVPSTTRLTVGHTRAFVKIGDGCNKFCAFCIVPYTRGRTRSIAPEEVVRQVGALSVEGYREIVLTAVHMGTYGLDLKGDERSDLTTLIRKVLTETSVERLRLSSVEPEDFPTDLLALWREHAGRICRHIHLAFDSGSESTLKRMRRRYDPDRYLEIVGLIRSAIPGVAITTDVMVGFPGETDEEYAQSRAFIERVGFSGIHVFKYSKRRGTQAERMPDQVDEKVKAARLDNMLALAKESARSFQRSLIGTRQSVLFERARSRRGEVEREGGQATWEGLTDNYVRTFVTTERDLTNALLTVEIGGLRKETEREEGGEEMAGAGGLEASLIVAGSVG